MYQSFEQNCYLQGTPFTVRVIDLILFVIPLSGRQIDQTSKIRGHIEGYKKTDRISP